MGKSKLTKKLTLTTPELFVRMTGHTKPKFAHNAIQANKDVVWS